VVRPGKAFNADGNLSRRSTAACQLPSVGSLPALCRRRARFERLLRGQNRSGGRAIDHANRSSVPETARSECLFGCGQSPVPYLHRPANVAHLGQWPWQTRVTRPRGLFQAVGVVWVMEQRPPGGAVAVPAPLAVSIRVGHETCCLWSSAFRTCLLPLSSGIATHTLDLKQANADWAC